MENKSNDSIRINIREPSTIGFCGCEACLQAYNNQTEVQIQFIFNNTLRNIRMNELINSFILDNMFQTDYQSDELINSLFDQASASNELERNEKVKIDVASVPFSETEKVFTNCSICSDDYKDEDIVSTLNCKHVFHSNCISEWGHYNPVCPVCKTRIATRND